jgi:glycerol-3-phosphate O-acyltransferase
MFRMVELHLWLLALILVFAGITLASHFLFPSVRWFFRLRAERALARINARLDRPIELFKLARRQDMIVRLTYDPRVLEAVTEHATLTPPVPTRVRHSTV